VFRGESRDRSQEGKQQPELLPIPSREIQLCRLQEVAKGSLRVVGAGMRCTRASLLNGPGRVRAVGKLQRIAIDDRVVGQPKNRGGRSQQNESCQSAAEAVSAPFRL